MESTYMTTTTLSMLLAMSGPQGWAELPTDILHSIIQLLGCTHNLLAFIATCPSWRAAFMEAKRSLCKLFPPLMIRSCAELSNNGRHFEVRHTWQLMDPADPGRRFHRPAPSTIPAGMEFVGCSYGHAIFADLSNSKTGGRVTMIDVFTGVQVSPPPCPVLAKVSWEFIDLLCCTLTAPMSSPKACLLISSGDITGLLVWRIGSDYWKYVRPEYTGLGPIDQIVVFKDKIITLDKDLSLCTVHLDDMVVRALLIVEEDTDDMVNSNELHNARLAVVPGDRLALIASPYVDSDMDVFFYLEGLNSQTEPTRWSPVPGLDCAVFIYGAYGSRAILEGWYGRWALTCAHPERWGGIIGDVTFAGHGDEVFLFSGNGRLLPSWVSHSVLSPYG